jgi:UrcA family protein
MFGNTFRQFGRAAAGLALVGASAALTSLPARADPYDRYTPAPAQDTVEGVTVYAPHRYVRQPTTGARVRLDTISMRVPLGDLDLSTPGGAREAKARIVEAAKDVCDEVQQVYSNGVEIPGGCYANAVREALAQTQRLAGYPIVAWGYR